MQYKYIILDLDNTIYPVSSIGEELFAPLFDLIGQTPAYKSDLSEIKKDIMRRPFQKVAADYHFTDVLIQNSLDLLANTVCGMQMTFFEDYEIMQKLPYPKFLVTVGFSEMQNSKIRQLGIASDFEEIFIVDPQKSTRTKKDIFQGIMTKYSLENTELLVIGDDPNSELQSAKALGIDTILYDKLNLYPGISNQTRVEGYKEIEAILVKRS